MRPWQGGGRPSDEEIRRLVTDEGYTDRQLADHFGVTEPTARYYRLQAGIKKAQQGRLNHRASGAIPWRFNTKLGHHRDPIARLLRARERIKAGTSQPPDVIRRVEELERDLAELDLVIEYDREDGFSTAERDPNIDDPQSIVRKPAL
jgi:hypothetical protein